MRRPFFDNYQRCPGPLIKNRKNTMPVYDAIQYLENLNIGWVGWSQQFIKKENTNSEWPLDNLLPWNTVSQSPLTINVYYTSSFML